MQRTNSAGYDFYLDSTFLANVAGASTSLGASGSNTNFNAGNPLSCGFIGKSFSVAQQFALY
jgi:hypothetical protein